MEIISIVPNLGVEGGLVTIECRGFELNGASKTFPRIRFGDVPAHLVTASSTRIVARIPQGVTAGLVYLKVGARTCRPYPFQVAKTLASGLHPVANPVIDKEGCVLTTFSGARGQRVEFSLFKITPEGAKHPLLAEIMNPTGMVFDSQGQLYISSRHNGSVHRITLDGRLERFAGDLGVATGLAMDKEDNLFVGDRSGVLYRVTPHKEVSTFANLEPSVSAYHMAFGPDERLYVSGPTISTCDSIYAIDRSGAVSDYFAGLGRPQGLAFDGQGALYIGASYKGKKGVFRIAADLSITHVVSAPIPVGLAFDKAGHLIVADNESLHSVIV